jgi:hypothetical protein
MRDYPLPNECHHLTQVLALGAYAESYRGNPLAAKAAVCAAFGLSGDLNDDLLLCALLLLSSGRFDEGRQLLLQVGLACPDKIPAVYAAAASVFKYFNAGMPIGQLAEFGVELLLPLYQAHPQRIEVQRALLDMLLYFGRADDVELILSQSDTRLLATEVEELRLYRERLQVPSHCKLSVALISYQRPAMLRHTLAILRAALVTTDYEIIIGVNDDWPETRQVVADAGINQVVFSESNIGINLYQQVFSLAQGEYLLEIDDDVAAFPPGFDQQIINCLEANPDLGLVGHWPVGFVDVENGQKLPAAEAAHERGEVAQLPFGYGPVAGVCAGMRRKDYLMINGLSRATLSRHSGEEPQLIRKLALYGKRSGVIFEQGLLVNVNG